MAQNNSTRYSFYQLLTDKKKVNGKDYKIVIPIIQRDYAQGRRTENTDEVRYEFLQTLYDYLKDEDSHDLDFVYGSSEDGSDRTSFIPLDGQQRLTTLFLLHWYLMQRATNKDNKNRMQEALTMSSIGGEGKKSAFLYMTRQSSSDFCNALVNESLDFSKLEKVKVIDDKGKEKEVESIEETLKNESWFVPSWSYDPTVQSMLVMLDAIHEHFNGENYNFMLSRLMDVDNPAIAFIFMDLDEYNLTDDLYIKMNSRGKSLTSFENFKAKFEQYIGSVESSLDKLLNSIKKKEGESIYTETLRDYFSYNIDTRWTNLFWAYCREELKDVSPKDMEKYLEKSLDRKMANFIRVIFTNQYACNPEHYSAEGRDVFDKYLINDSVEYISFVRYQKLGALTPKCIDYLIQALNLFSIDAKDGRIAPVLNQEYSYYYNEDEMFNMAINGHSSKNDDTFQYPYRVRFHAYLRYRINFPHETDNLGEFMRVVYNLTQRDNRPMDNSLDFAQAIMSINSVLDGMIEASQPSVLEFLAAKGNEYKLTFFPTWQVNEEVIKANLILKKTSDNIKWETAIKEAEKIDYCNAQIGFLLKFSGIKDYFNVHSNCEWNEEENKVYFDTFNRYCKITREVFKGGYDKRVLATDSLFERAMLALHPEYVDETKGDGNRANLLSSTRAGNIRRDYSWRTYLRKDCLAKLVQNLFDKLNPDKDIRSELNGIIAKYPAKSKWTEALIKYPDNIELCVNGFVYFFNYDATNAQGDFMLLGSKYTSQNDAELYTYTLWNHGGIKNNDFGKVSLEYKKSNSWNEYPHIRGTFSYLGQTYQIKLFAKSINGDFNYYYFVVMNENYYPLPEEMKECVYELGFKENEDAPNDLVLTSKATDYLESTVVTELANICSTISKRLLEDNSSN
jgi:hypothetical protein